MAANTYDGSLQWSGWSLLPRKLVGGSFLRYVRLGVVGIVGALFCRRLRHESRRTHMHFDFTLKSATLQAIVHTICSAWRQCDHDNNDGICAASRHSVLSDARFFFSRRPIEQSARSSASLYNLEKCFCFSCFSQQLLSRHLLCYVKTLLSPAMSSTDSSNDDEEETSHEEGADSRELALRRTRALSTYQKLIAQGYSPQAAFDWFVARAEQNRYSQQEAKIYTSALLQDRGCQIPCFVDGCNGKDPTISELLYVILE